MGKGNFEWGWKQKDGEGGGLPRNQFPRKPSKTKTAHTHFLFAGKVLGNQGLAHERLLHTVTESDYTTICKDTETIILVYDVKMLQPKQECWRN